MHLLKSQQNLFQMHVSYLSNLTNDLPVYRVTSWCPILGMQGVSDSTKENSMLLFYLFDRRSLIFELIFKVGLTWLQFWYKIIKISPKSYAVYGEKIGFKFKKMYAIQIIFIMQTNKPIIVIINYYLIYFNKYLYYYFVKLLVMIHYQNNQFLK